MRDGCAAGYRSAGRPPEGRARGGVCLRQRIGGGAGCGAFGATALLVGGVAAQEAGVGSVQPAAGSAVTGTLRVSGGSDAATLTVDLQGLEAGQEYAAFLHAGT